jgi:hypothetical protein
MEKKIYTRSQILKAMDATLSVRAAARYLGCCYKHLKRYMLMYRVDENDINSPTLFEAHKNKSGIGIPKHYLGPKYKGFDIKKILFTGKTWEHFDANKIKTKAIAEGYLKEECCKCGFHERRLTDYRMPLLMHFRDANKNNYLLENLQLMCYNCYFIYVGPVLSNDQIRHIEANEEVRSKPFDWELDLDNSMLENMRDLGIEV